MKQLVIVGAGGLGREILTLVSDINRASTDSWEVLGFIARDEPDEQTLARIKATYLGSDRDQGLLRALQAAHFVAAIGSSSLRRSVYERVSEEGLSPATLVHPTALLGLDVQLGSGTIIAAGAILTTHVRLGTGTLIDRNVNVGHDCILGNFVTLAPGAILSGSVKMGDQSYMGTNSCTIQGVTVGASTTVGAGAVVTRDVEGGVTVVGIPARPINQ